MEYQGPYYRYKQCLMKEKIRKEQPTLVMLHESKFSSKKIIEISHRFWKGSQSIALDIVGHVGQLVILWNLEENSILYIFSPPT